MLRQLNATILCIPTFIHDVAFLFMHPAHKYDEEHRRQNAACKFSRRTLFMLTAKAWWGHATAAAHHEAQAVSRGCENGSI